MKKTDNLLHVKCVVALVVLLMSTTYAQSDKSDLQSNKSDLILNAENTIRAPFILATNTQQSMQSIMQNSEKDIVFIENLGQIRDIKGKKRPDVLFHTRSQSVDMYITSTGITYVFRKTEGDPKADDLKTSYYRLDMEFVGINKNIEVKKELAIEQQFNYFTSEYPNGISPKGFKKVTIENIYYGIDLVHYEKEGKMKYDFVVKAGADAKKIKMNYKGADKVYIDKDGNAIITTPMGEIREEKPYTYSRNTGKEIESSYKVKNNFVQLNIAGYNSSEDIVIDPYRIWATYYGGSSDDYGKGICTDNSGNLYVTGNTGSNNFPLQTLTGAYNQTNMGGGYDDVFILKFNSSGAKIWATYYGGNDEEYGEDICTDNSGNLYVTGRTSSTNFPTKTLSGAYNQTSKSYYIDAFILRFNSSGERIWATYYGGFDDDIGYSICTDNSGTLYVVGGTESRNFHRKTLAGAYNQTTHGGGSHDAFILKFNSSSERMWATYYGGNNEDQGRSVCTDNTGNLYITGYAKSSNFPTKILSGAYNDTTLGDSYGDAYILKFNSNGERLWATYYGGNSTDQGHGICIDNSSTLYVTGHTGSTNFPTQTLAGAYNQTTLSSSHYDTFILKFNGSGARIWATYYGGDNSDRGTGICTDSSNNICVIGYTSSSDFPTKTITGGYNQTSFGGYRDVFILKFNSSGERAWATYYGGSNYDYGYGLCTDNPGNLYVTGNTSSTDFPTQTLTGAYNQTTRSGGDDAFILKFNSTVDIKKISNEIPVKYSLFQNYPNPFNPTTNIKFNIPKSSFVKVVIYNVLGKEITTLVNKKLQAGSYEVEFNVTQNSILSSGVYFYRLEVGDYVETRKMLLVK